MDIARDEPEAYAAWMRGGADFRFPGGESLQEHADRVWAGARRHPRHRPAAGAGRLPPRLDPGRALPSDPRGLDAFHEYDVPNTGVVQL